VTNVQLLQDNYIAPRIVLAASGVDHEELLSLAEPLLGDLESKPCPQEPKSVYIGGDYRCQADPLVCFIFLTISIEHHSA
jgi:mitochondrial-processing peptidase subunit alpha